MCSINSCLYDSLLSDTYGSGSATAFVNIDGTKMIVFGKDVSGKARTGIMNYPNSSSPAFTVPLI